MGEATQELLDRAATGREIGTAVALVLMRVEGDPEAALALIADLQVGTGIVAANEELDALTIAAQAIREACGMTGRELNP